MTAGETVRDRRHRRPRVPALAALGAGLSVVVVYVWDDALFAAPVVAATRWFGAWPAFLVLSVIYSTVSFVLAVLVVRMYDRRSGNAPNRIARWVEQQGESQRSGWIRNLLLSGRAVGFVLSSFLIGGIVTTFLIRYSGRSHRIVLAAFLSSVIFGVTFVGLYSGAGRIVFGS